MRSTNGGLSLSLVTIAALLACGAPHTTRQATGDTSFAATQVRGRMVMGVDQYTSTHVFEDLPDGGRIVLDRDSAGDTAGIRVIRAHMRTIATDFAAGDFSNPFEVHAEVVPGTPVMTARRARISYEALDRPRGGEVRIRSTDSTAVAAIHAFLAFQRSAHHAGGHESMNMNGEHPR